MGVNLRDLLIFVTLLYKLTTWYSTLSTLLLLKLAEFQRIEQLRMFLQLRTAIGGTGENEPCNGLDNAETKDLRDKTGGLVIDLKIPSDLRENIYSLQVHTSTFFQRVLN